ncbi:hypothetical protein [Gordonia sp. NPDC003376]
MSSSSVWREQLSEQRSLRADLHRYRRYTERDGPGEPVPTT